MTMALLKPSHIEDVSRSAGNDFVVAAQDARVRQRPLVQFYGCHKFGGCFRRFGRVPEKGSQ